MKKFSHAPVFAYGAACVLLSIGILLRMYIMRRPPVTTLYESILFVSWVCASVSAILYNLQKKSIWLGVGSFLSFFLLYLSRGYAAEGDTLGVLIAVLNTNFWLATHVICMTIGYGLCLLLSVWAHLALVGRAYLSHDKSQWKANQNILWILTLLALLFSLVGTILGGLWADQSWGRFWGWDPKENGALFVVLWLLFLLHAKMNPKFFNLGFCVGSLLSSIVVALAWFGVNLLSVGLHSYGFTENIAWKLGSFCLLELVVAIFLLLKIQKMSRPYAQSL
jgi:ABC-type transport system involved in cytochrome c biogenesis permease subunit